MDLRSEAVGLGKVKAGLVDVGGNDTRCAVRLCEGTGEKADCTDAKDEDALARCEVGSSRSMEKDR